MEDRSDIAKKIVEELNENKDIAIYEELLKDNVVSFKLDDKQYRIRRMTLSEKQELLENKAVKFGELSTKPNWKFKEQIIAEAKAKGYDLEKIDSEITDTQKEIDDQYEVLAKMTDKTRIKRQEDKIKILFYRQEQSSQRKSTLFQFSIEDYLDFYVKSYLGYLTTEIKVKNEFNKTFKNYNEFINSKDFNLIREIAFYVNFLIKVGELA